MMQDIKNHKITEGNIPKYEQARRRLLKYIAAMPPDAEYLPFEYELVKMFGISRVCIRRALAELRKEGIIQTMRSRGSKVLRRDIRRNGAGLDLSNTPVAAIFPADTKEGRPTDFFIWRIAEQLEHLIQGRNGSMEYMNLRRGNDTFLSPEETVRHIMERGIRWALVFHHEKIDTYGLVSLMLKNHIKPLVFFSSQLVMQKNCGAILTGTDFMADNHNPIIYETLASRFKDCDYIAALTNSANMYWAEFRAKAVQRFAQNFGIKYELLVDDSCKKIADDPYFDNQAISTASGARLTESLLSKLQTARRPLLFGVNDFFALGALEQLKKSGLRCPEDVEVMGFDNIAKAQSGNMSTFANNAEAVANTAFKSLTRFLEDPQTSLSDGIGRLTSPVFFDRNTTKAVEKYRALQPNAIIPWRKYRP